MVTFLNEQAGTHRTVGGKLDASAGTIETLDAIVSKLTGSNLGTVREEAKKVAQGLKGKYAEYYVKVLDKIADNKQYAEKEVSRLQKMLKKGGLAPSKEDDLVSRLNVLKKFGASDETVENIKEEL